MKWIWEKTKEIISDSGDIIGNILISVCDLLATILEAIDFD